MAGYSRRIKEAHKDSMYQAWHTAAFQRSKTMPSLKKVMGDPTKAKRGQTPEQMLAVMTQFAKMNSRK